MVFALTEDMSKDFLKKLEKAEGKSSRLKKTNYRLLEPRVFKIFLKDHMPDEVLELSRKSDACSQVCEQLGIAYKGIHDAMHSKDRTNNNLPDDFGNVILGAVPYQKTERVVQQVVPRLKPGKFLAVFQYFDFIASVRRRENIFLKMPFDLMLVMTQRPQVSADGHFDVNYKQVFGGAWYIWYGKENPNEPTRTEMRWVTDDCFEDYYIFDENGHKVKVARDEKGKMLPYTFAQKKPIEVIVDLGKSERLRKWNNETGRLEVIQ